jgi:predicted DsbA family dithiol-disulfide isomerase
MPMKIDFVSDVTCPWCAIGLTALLAALDRLGGAVQAEIRPQPFELNPGMAPGGEDIVAYMGRKYGMSAEQVAARRAVIRQRGAEVGFAFGPRERTWNTFDAHRLLHWAGLEGRGLALKLALLAAYHGRGEDPSSPEVLLRLAGEVGLDVARARAVLDGGEYAAEVRERIGHWRALGIDSVPAAIVDGRHLIQGGQPVEVWEKALREIAAGRAP